LAVFSERRTLGETAKLRSYKDLYLEIFGRVDNVKKIRFITVSVPPGPEYEVDNCLLGMKKDLNTRPATHMRVRDLGYLSHSNNIVMKIVGKRTSDFPSA
jgi:hypothetical protein